MTIETYDYVERGIASWPEKTRGEKAMKYLAVYLRAIQDNEDKVAELLNAFINWYRPGQSFSFVLDIVGSFMLGQPRPAEFIGDDENYRTLLVARTITRASDGSEGAVLLLIDFLSRINGGQGNYNVVSGVAEHWFIDIFDVQLTPTWQQLYVTLIFDAIGAVDSFTLNINNNGAGVYDSEAQGYDVALYS